MSEVDAGAEGGSGELRIISRAEWRASPALLPPLEMRSEKVQHVFFLDLKVNPCNTPRHCSYTMHMMQDSDIQYYNDIRHNFVVGGDGQVYEGRGWAYCPVLPRRLDHLKYSSLSIGYVGKMYDGPPDYMQQAGAALVRKGVALGHIDKYPEVHKLYSKSNYGGAY